MSKRSLGYLIAGIVAVALLAVGVVWEVDLLEVQTEDKHYYVGKILMEKEEYTEFKSILAREDVQIGTLNVYSSDNPLVTFEVWVPTATEFPWGEVTNTRYVYPGQEAKQVLAPLMLVLSGLIGMILLMTWLSGLWGEVY